MKITIGINEKPVKIKLNETNITDNRKARKKIRIPAYSEAVKRTADKDIGEKIGLNEQSLGDGVSSQDDELLRILEDLQN